MQTKKKVAVYWDYENCPVPSGVDMTDAVRRIKDIVRAEEWGEIDRRFSVFLDIKKGPRSLRPANRCRELRLSGADRIFFVDCPHRGKMDVVDKAIIRHMVGYATMDVPANEKATFVLITGDGDFTDAVTTLKWLKHTVIVIASASLSGRLAAAASRVLHWNTDVVSKNHGPRWIMLEEDEEDEGVAQTSDSEELSLYCGAMFLGPMSPTDSGSDGILESISFVGEETTFDEPLEAQLLIPRSFEPLVRWIQDHPDKLIDGTGLRQQLDSESAGWDREYISFENYIEHAVDLDIIEIHGRSLHEVDKLWISLTQPQWWDGFDW